VSEDSRLVHGDGLSLGRVDVPPTHDAWRRDTMWLLDGLPYHAHMLAFAGPSLWVTFPGRAPVVADRHQVLFYSNAQVYRRGLLSAEGDRCTIVMVSEAIIRRMVREFDPEAADAVPFRFRHLHAFVDSRTYLLLRRLALCADPGFERATPMLETVVRHSIAAAYRPARRPARTETGQRDRCRLVEYTKAVVADPYGPPPSLRSIAAEVGTSPYHLTRIFGDVTGLPLHRYVAQIRLRSAVDLVLTPGVRLAGIAHELGFASQSHFTTAFRELFGITPDALRRGCDVG
jgi:AraC-like DNA-binding protein